MTRKELYERALSFILTAHSQLIPGTDPYLDIEDYIVNEDMDMAANALLAAPNIPITLKPFLLSISSTFSQANKEDDIIPEYDIIELFKPLSSTQKYQRDFYYRGAGLSVVESSFLYPDDNTVAYNEDIWLTLQNVLLIDALREDLINRLARGRESGYLIGFNKGALGYPVATADADVDRENLYAFALASSLKDHRKLEIKDDLKYNNTLLALHAFNYNYKIVYQQYYDIVDVIDEWLHADDILVAFTKMYQIVEYIVYRKQMYSIVNSSSLKQSFLRGVKTMTKNYEDTERVSVTKGIKALFSGIRPSILNIRAAQVFIGEYFGKSKTGNLYLCDTTPVNDMDDSIARFIYDMRCSIVHNKEAELHITYSNYEIYRSVIPLAVEVHDAMMVKIWDLLNTENNGIEYNKKQLDLY